MANLLVIGIVHVSHYTIEGSQKRYGAVLLPGTWLRGILLRKGDYLENLGMALKTNPSNWFSTLDRAKRLAMLFIEDRQDHFVVLDPIPIMGIQGEASDPDGYTFLDENEIWVNDDYYKIEVPEAA
jgi:hypothetical protein